MRSSRFISSNTPGSGRSRSVDLAGVGLRLQPLQSQGGIAQRPGGSIDAEDSGGAVPTDDRLARGRPACRRPDRVERIVRGRRGRGRRPGRGGQRIVGGSTSRGFDSAARRSRGLDDPVVAGRDARAGRRARGPTSRTGRHARPSAFRAGAKGELGEANPRPRKPSRPRVRAALALWHARPGLLSSQRSEQADDLPDSRLELDIGRLHAHGRAARKGGIRDRGV